MSCPKSQREYTVWLVGRICMNKPRPYLGAALLCENVIEEKNGALTLVRITDRLEYEMEGVPQGSSPVIVIRGLIAIRSGPVQGEFSLEIRPLRPNGQPKGPPLKIPPVKLLGGDHGANIILNMQLMIEEEGLHWFDVYFEDELLTRIPLIIARKQAPSATP